MGYVNSLLILVVVVNQRIDFCPVNSKMHISAIMFIGEDCTFRRPSTDVQWSKPGRRGRGPLHQVEEAEETVGVLAS